MGASAQGQVVQGAAVSRVEGWDGVAWEFGVWVWSRMQGSGAVSFTSNRHVCWHPPRQCFNKGIWSLSLG